MRGLVEIALKPGSLLWGEETTSFIANLELLEKFLLPRTSRLADMVLLLLPSSERRFTQYSLLYLSEDIELWLMFKLFSCRTEMDERL